MIGSENKKQVLGRGLGALIPAARGTNAPQPESGIEIQAEAHSRFTEAVREVEIAAIEPNPFQTRLEIDQKGIDELAESIKAQGVLQPIVIRYIEGNRYQLVAGQRRLLASERAGKTTVPAILRQMSEQQAIEITIIENLQREDLNPLDQALAFERLSQHCGLTQEQIAARTGKERATVTNYMRLLKLPQEVQQNIRKGTLSMGHARALMALSHPGDQVLAASKIEERSLSVRQSEIMVAEWHTPKTRRRSRAEKPKDPNVKHAEHVMLAATGCRTTIEDNGGKGKMIIEYLNLDDFERVMAHFDKWPE